MVKSTTETTIGLSEIGDLQIIARNFLSGECVFGTPYLLERQGCSRQGHLEKKDNKFSMSSKFISVPRPNDVAVGRCPSCINSPVSVRRRTSTLQIHIWP